jgi:hypothetical protein
VNTSWASESVSSASTAVEELALRLVVRFLDRVVDSTEQLAARPVAEDR